MSKIICTLGPQSLNKEFLKFSNKKIHLLRLNMSHLSLNKLSKAIIFIRKYSTVPICIDTEGAQIRIQVKRKKFFKKNQTFYISNKRKNTKLYPECVLNNLNRKIKLNYLTEKDLEAIKIGKKLKIKNYALSFTNSVKDIVQFNQLLKDENKIFKIETKNAIKSFKKILKYGDQFLIDRGDLSKDVKIENIPVVQRNLFKLKQKYKNKKIYIATNLLESMLENNYPTRGEANDIFNSLEMGAAGLVLAAETAVGKHPQDSVRFLQKMIKAFVKSNL